MCWICRSAISSESSIKEFDADCRRMISSVLASGARGLRSSWASMARNSSLRRAASCSSSACRKSCISIRFRSVMSETRQRAPLMAPCGVSNRIDADVKPAFAE